MTAPRNPQRFGESVSTTGDDAASSGSDGRWVIDLDVWSTVLFGVSAAYAAAVFNTAAQWVGAIVAMALFAIGVAAFIWSYWVAVQRSRTDEISVAELYLLLGPATPRPVKRKLNLALLAQIAIGLVSTMTRLQGPNGQPGSSLAVGLLVPMLGFGLNGLWASKYAKFRPRRATAASADTTPSDRAQAADGPDVATDDALSGPKSRTKLGFAADSAAHDEPHTTPSTTEIRQDAEHG